MRTRILTFSRALGGPTFALALTAFGRDASAYHDPGSEWLQGTAYTLRGGEFSLGVLRWEAGVLDELTIGTLPVLWCVGPWLGSPVPNGFIKVRDWLHGDFAISAQTGVLYVNGSELVNSIDDAREEADLWVVDVGLASTWRSRGPLSLGLSLQFTESDLGGTRDAAEVEGTVVSDSVRVASFAEWRFTRVVALQLNAHVLAFRRAPNGELSVDPRPGLHVEADVSISNVAPPGAWAVWSAVAFSWSHVNLMLGAGYGYRSLPIVNVMLDERGPIVTFDFFVRFGG